MCYSASVSLYGNLVHRTRAALAASNGEKPCFQYVRISRVGQPRNGA